MSSLPELRRLLIFIQTTRVARIISIMFLLPGWTTSVLISGCGRAFLLPPSIHSLLRLLLLIRLPVLVMVVVEVVVVMSATTAVVVRGCSSTKAVVTMQIPKHSETLSPKPSTLNPEP